MRTVQVIAETSLSPERVLAAAYDFSERRPEFWPNVQAAHYVVHSVGEQTADVTEGSKAGPVFGWERCDYDWSQPGRVVAVVTDSNVYRPGSSWTMAAAPADGHTRVEFTWRREFTWSVPGRILSVIYPTLGKRLLGHDAVRTLRLLEQDEGAGERR